MCDYRRLSPKLPPLDRIIFTLRSCDRYFHGDLSIQVKLPIDLWQAHCSTRPYAKTVMSSFTRPIFNSRPHRSLVSFYLLGLVAACSSDTLPSDHGDTSDSAVDTASGGNAAASSGGASSSGGSTNAGGTPNSGGQGSGGALTSTGGAMVSSGGLMNTGGEAAMSSGGAPAGSGGMMNESFRPCPEAAPCKILPLGDSITVGWGSSHNGGYRVELFHLARAAGHDITFTGTRSPTGPNTVDGTNFPRKHEGIASEKIVQIMSRVDHAIDTEVPHIVLVHAGTNDISMMPGGAEERLETLVDKLISDLPDALIVVSNIVPFPQYSSLITSFNASVQPMLNERIDAGAHLIFVDQFAGFPTSELPDGVHPNDAGYTRMANKWYSAIEDYL